MSERMWTTAPEGEIDACVTSDDWRDDRNAYAREAWDDPEFTCDEEGD